jgi:hypothetical protein
MKTRVRGRLLASNPIRTRKSTAPLAVQSSPVFLGLRPYTLRCHSVDVNGLFDGLAADWIGPRSGKDLRRLVQGVPVAGLSLCVS